MLVRVGVCGLVASLALLAAAADEAVVSLTQDTFKPFIDENPISLVEFYAPWCGHCKQLAPEYEKAAKELKGKIPLAKVDATVEEKLAQEFDVQGFPTIKFFKKGKPQEYDGGRTSSDIVEWLEKQTGPAVTNMTKDEFKTMIDTETVVVSAKFTDKSHSLYKVFEEVADLMRMAAKFVQIDDNQNKIVIHRKGEDAPIVYSGAADAEELGAWVEEERFHLFGEINAENFQSYDERKREGIAWVCVKMEKSNQANVTAVTPIFRAMAKEYPQYSFVWLDTQQFGEHVESFLGISDDDYPAMVITTKEDKKYRWTGPAIEKSAIKQFIEDVRAGKVEPFLKSQPIPETNDEPVKVVVGKNFDEMVFHADKDVMLEVYAPWCGHCKKLEPQYNAVAEMLAKNEHIMLAKLDGTANEVAHSDFQYEGFPTIFYVKAGEKKPIPYEGDRTKKGIIKFIKKNASKPVEITETKAAATKEPQLPFVDTAGWREWMQDTTEKIEELGALLDSYDELKRIHEEKKGKKAKKTSTKDEL
mmetsp:Transcript_41472/g.103514  ORF Transcript_41472/g.103514 Transcript_41472/m.103514 type:complete len:530 (+) Transcript_41472:126-1715(+)